MLLHTYEYLLQASGGIISKTDENGTSIYIYIAITHLVYKCKRKSQILSRSGEDSLSILRPAHGPGLHSFTALSERVVILDIIGPPYDDEDRNCHYFKDLSTVSDQNNHINQSVPSLDLMPSTSSSERTSRSFQEETIVWISPIQFEFNCVMKNYQFPTTL